MRRCFTCLSDTPPFFIASRIIVIALSCGFHYLGRNHGVVVESGEALRTYAYCIYRHESCGMVVGCPADSCGLVEDMVDRLGELVESLVQGVVVGSFVAGYGLVEDFAQAFGVLVAYRHSVPESEHKAQVILHLFP